MIGSSALTTGAASRVALALAAAAVLWIAIALVLA